MNPIEAALAGRPQWMDDGICAQTDPDAFYPEKGGSTREAKRICLGCEVKDECLQYALEHRERFGIWGGLSERERRKLLDRKPQREFGPPQHDPALIARVLALLVDYHVDVIAQLTGVSPRTVRRIRDTQQNGAAA